MGQLLDGRNRRRACQELGIPLKVEQFVGTDQAALTYVLSVNQHRRELSKSQRAAVAVQLLPFISADVQAKRSARITATQRRKRTGEIMSRVAGSPPGASSEPALTRSVAADRMERLARTRRLSVHRRERRERRESFPNHEGHEAHRVWGNRSLRTSSLRSLRSLWSMSHLFVPFMVAVTSSSLFAHC